MECVIFGAFVFHDEVAEVLRGNGAGRLKGTEAVDQGLDEGVRGVHWRCVMKGRNEETKKKTNRSELEKTRTKRVISIVLVPLVILIVVVVIK